MKPDLNRSGGPIEGISAIVVAAGGGTRFGGPKQFSMLAGVPVAQRSVDAARAVATSVVLVVPPDYAGGDHGADRIVVGGTTRSASVRNGLGAVPESTHIVVIHDAARPLASASLFLAVIHACEEDGVGGAICGVAVTDTIKSVARSEPDGVATVSATLDRNALVAIQTPQAFRLDVIRRAHASNGEATDDAALVELLGTTVRVVPGDPRNVKITTPGDIAAAASLIGQAT